MDHPSPHLQAAAKAIAILGGPSKAARILNVPNHSYQTVQSWLKNGVPAKYCPPIERETIARGEAVRCEALDPEFPWGILRDQAATEQSTEA